MLIDHIYKLTEIGSEQRFAFRDHQDVVETLERFSRELERLDELAEQGMVEVTAQHSDEESGERYVDAVRFRRLK
ncbi:hypothetical protein ACQ859_16215 [Roseateles chitinivorans]|uniref:hypothetical protein n=1 Tax=Roseateles chitinivorans TaxID=2917965 RepID=UPI003D66457D